MARYRSSPCALCTNGDGFHVISPATRGNELHYQTGCRRGGIPGVRGGSFWLVAGSVLASMRKRMRPFLI